MNDHTKNILAIGMAVSHLQQGEAITVNVVFFLVAAAVAFARKDRLKGE